MLSCTLLSCFLHGAMRLRHASHVRVLAWDLAIVIECLPMVPFEPIESVSKVSDSKNSFLASYHIFKESRRSISPSCLEFAPGKVKAFLPTNIASIILQAHLLFRHQTSFRQISLHCPLKSTEHYCPRSCPVV